MEIGSHVHRLSDCTGKIVGISKPWYRVTKVLFINDEEVMIEVEYPDGGDGTRIVPEQDVGVFADW